MAVNVGYATLQIIPSARGFQRRLGQETEGPSRQVGRQSGGGFGSAFTGGMMARSMTLGRLGGPWGMAAAAAVGAIGTVVKATTDMEKDFSKTMSTMGAVANVPAKELEDLAKLAEKLGAETTFSANQAAEAMLELAKGGITPADIKAGALKSTLTLAAAGGLELADAATIASNTMAQFSLEGKDMADIAAALAGGANASSASVESLAEGLSNLGPAAKGAGMDLNDTVGVLSLFDAKSLKGGEAGTSLKTVLGRLAPTTKRARAEMQRLGLDFVDAQGNFVPISNVAQQLQDKLSKLGQAERTTAINTIFGAEANRAAGILMEAGAKGVDKFTKATKDKKAAENVAAAATKGTAGAIEALGGSYEGLKKSIGDLTKVPVEKTLRGTASALNWVADGMRGIPKASKVAGSAMGSAFKKTGDVIGPAFKKGMDALPGMLASAGKGLAGFGSNFGSGMFDAIKGAGKDIGKVLGPVWKTMSGAITGSLLPALKGSGAALVNVGKAFKWFGELVFDIFSVIFSVAKPVVMWLIRVFGKVLADSLMAVGGIFKGLILVITGVINVLAGLFTGKWGKMWKGLTQIVAGAFSAIWSLVKGLFMILWHILGSGVAKILGILARGMIAGLKAIFVTFPVWVIKGLAKVIVAVTSWAAKIVAKAMNAMIRFGAAVGRGIASAVKWFAGLAGKALSALGGLAGSLMSLASRALTAMATGIKNGIKWVVAEAQQIATKIRATLMGFYSAAKGFAGELISGLVQGIKDGLGQLWEAGVGLVKSLFGGAKKEADSKSPSREMIKLGDWIVQGLVIGVNAGSGKAYAAGVGMGAQVMKGATKGASKAPGIAQKVKDKFKANYVGFGEALSKKSTTNMEKALLELGNRIKDITAKTNKAAVGAKLAAGVTTAWKNKVKPLAKAYDALSVKLAAARETMKPIEATFTSMTESLVGSLDLINNAAAAETMEMHLDDRLAKLEQFNTDLADLARRGASKELLGQFTEAGLDSGAQMAAALKAAQDTDIARISQKLGQFTAGTKTVADTMTKEMYGVGYVAQKSLIDGFVADQAVIKGKIKTIGDNMLKSIKASLGIKSPSTEFIKVGTSMIDGLVLGIERGASRVAGSLKKVAKPPAKSKVAGAPKAPKKGVNSPAGKASAAIPVTVPLYLDGAEIARAVFSIGAQEYARGRI